MYTENELKKHLSGAQFKNIYLVFGEEKMLVKRVTQLIEKKISGGDLNDFNYHVFSDDTDIAPISVSADIIPFMSEYNIIKLVDFNIDKMPKEDFDDLMKILKGLPESTIAIITMPTLDVTSKTAKAQFKKLITLADKSGVCIELSHRSGLKLERDLCKWARDGGCTMTELTAHLLIQYVGEDLNRLNTELKKLTAYADGAEITPAMIELLVHKTAEASIYDLFGYIMSGSTDRVMAALSVLFYEQVSGVLICNVLSGAYLDAYRARIGADAGKSMDDVASAFAYGKRAWVLKKMLTATRSVTLASLRRSIDELLTVQTRLVTETSDERIEIERLVCKLVLIAEDRADE